MIIDTEKNPPFIACITDPETGEVVWGAYSNREGTPHMLIAELKAPSNTDANSVGYDHKWLEKEWLAERKTAIAALRAVCSDHGDNDWSDRLHLADIIEKHLHRNLEN